MKKLADAIGISQPAFRELLGRDVLRRAFIKHPYFSDVVEAYRLDRKVGEFEEGTLLVKTVDGAK